MSHSKIKQAQSLYISVTDFYSQNSLHKAVELHTEFYIFIIKYMFMCLSTPKPKNPWQS